MSETLADTPKVEDTGVPETTVVDAPVAAEQDSSVSPAEVKDSTPESTQTEEKKRLRTIVDMGGGAVACVICEKRSYPAETIYFEKLPYHTECFSCAKCKAKLPNVTQASKYEDDIYCRACFNAGGYARLQAQVKWQPKTTSNTMPSKFGGGGTPCTICAKTVYPAEQVNFDGKPYHGECLKCSECNVGCNVTNVNQFESNLFCRGCWEKGGYAQKQVKAHTRSNTTSGSYSSIALKFGGGGTKCTICTKTVYPAEQVNFDGKPYHGECIKCSECNVGCNVTNVNQFEGNLLCRSCWEKGGYARKQVTSTGTNRVTVGSSNSLARRFGGGGTKCTICAKTVYPAEQVNFDTKPYHGECIKCSECNVACNVTNVNQFEGNLFCRGCWEKGGYAQKQVKSTHTRTGTTSGTYSAAALKFGGGGTKCTICTKTVYPAEHVTFDGKPYHGDCLKCSECNVSCNLTNVNQFEGSLFCKGCWERGGYAQKQRDVKWAGPKEGTTATASKFGGGGNPCSKCSKTVYPAEQFLNEGVIYHANCFTCTNCSSKLGGTTRYESKATKPYCQKCWNDLGLWRPDA